MPTLFVIRLPFTLLTYTIMHLVYPPTLCTTIVFACCQGINCNTQEKLEIMVMDVFFCDGEGGGGVNKVHNGVCEMVSTENSSKSLTFMVMFW